MFTKKLLRSSGYGGATSPTNSTSSSLTSTTSSNNNNKNSSNFRSSKLERFLKGRASNTKNIQEKSKKYGVEWQSYDAVAKCNRCEKPFTPLRRKHHCRQCGLIYCSACTSTKLKVEGSQNLKRVCRKCANNMQSVVPSDEKTTASKSSNAANKTKAMVLIEDANFYYHGALENDAMLHANFNDVLNFGIARWYRVLNEGEEDNNDWSTSVNSKPIYEEKIIRAEDTIYKVHRDDIGYKLKCIIYQGKSTTFQSSNKKICIITDEIVHRAVPTLENAAIQIGLRPHKHTLKCDRTTRICTAAGKYREGETLYVEPNIRGLEVGGDVFIVCRFLRCKETFDDYGNEIGGKERRGRKTINSSSSNNNSGGGGNNGGEDVEAINLDFSRDQVTMAKVLYNFDGKNENELQVEEGDILTCLDLIDDNDEWIVCLGSDGNIGSIPRSFVKCYSMPVQRKSELWENDREADLYGEDEPLCRQWRSMIGNFLHFDTVAETKKQFEYNLGKADVGKSIVCEVEMYRGTEPIGKAVRSMPVGPIEPAPPRIDDLKIVGSRTINSTLKAHYIYYGGMEGASRFMWIRVTTDGKKVELVNTKTYEVVAEDINCKLRVKITPVRSCGMEGKPTASASVKIVEKSAVKATSSTSKRINRLKKARASLITVNNPT